MINNALLSLLLGSGILFLLWSFALTFKIQYNLREKHYNAQRWYFIQVLLLLFLLGYGYELLIVTGVILPFLPSEVMVVIVYFFGAIFTVITLVISQKMIQAIFGVNLSDDEAIKQFIAFTGYSGDINNLRKEYNFICEDCGKNVTYSVISVVRNHSPNLSKGISVEVIFGTTSYLLRPIHECKSGFRETIMIHDEKLEFRSMEGSRLLYKKETIL